MFKYIRLFIQNNKRHIWCVTTTYTNTHRRFHSCGDLWFVKRDINDFKEYWGEWLIKPGISGKNDHP